MKNIGNVAVSLAEDGLVKSIKLTGRPLYLTRDNTLLHKQFAGEELGSPPTVEELYAHVSTDAIIKANPDCYYYDDRLGKLVLRSLGKGEHVRPGDIRKGGFGMILAGDGWGEGSSREIAALALLYGGIGAVFAPSIAPIHRQNLINNGMFPITNESTARKLAAGEEISIEELTEGFDDLTIAVMKRGGIFPYFEARARGEETDAPVDTPAKPMNISEKIMASHMKTVHQTVQPGDAGFLQVDAAFSHDYTTAPAAAMVEAQLGRPPRVKSPQTIHTFPDHLTLAPQLPGITEEALEGIRDLRSGQRKLAEQTGIQFHAQEGGGATGICHTVIREQVARPGYIVLGTDSHTCSAGALNCFAYGIGNSEIASIWEHNEVISKVPRSVRINLTGKLSSACTAKDAILHLARIGKETACFTGRVMEFAGEGLASMPLEEQAVLANMAVECNAITAIMEPTDSLRTYLQERRGLSAEEIAQTEVFADKDAHYETTVDLDLETVEPLVAKPGHPGNGVPLSEVRGTPLNIAYAGSCTAGDLTSIGMYAEVLAGKKVSIPTYIQYGSIGVREEAKKVGYHDTLVEAGVDMITEPGCGACINAGPGGPQKGQVAISASNRNMPGRMGDGDAYLANPAVVAASAVKGTIAAPEDL